MHTELVTQAEPVSNKFVKENMDIPRITMTNLRSFLTFKNVIVTISAESIPLDFTPARRKARRSTQFLIKGSFSSNESMISEKGLRSFVVPIAP